MTTVEYLKRKKLNNYNYDGIQVSIKQAPNNIDVKKVLDIVKSKIPSHLLLKFKKLQVGQFPGMKEREIQAMYNNGTIYITNELEDNGDMLDDIIHEVAHSVEDLYSDFLYSDGKIKKEFLKKRLALKNYLEKRQISTDRYNFLNPAYDIEFDNFLYREIGYDKLRSVTTGLFYSPYGSTSLKEYFANGFEAFFMKEELSILKSVSPVLYEKLERITDMEFVKNEI